MTNHTSNLPTWPGADAVYHRVNVILEELGRREYAAFQQRKNPRKADRFTPSAEMIALIDATKRGDEEAMKAALFTHRALLDAGRARQAERLAA